MTTLTKSDNPRSPIAPASGRKASAKHILIVVDDSDQSMRAVQYVGSLLRETQDVNVMLFHVLNPMPRELMEHGGSEDPTVEDHLGEQLRKDQEEWVRTEGAVEYPILVKALERLGQTGFPIDRATLKFGHERDIADTIVDEARAGGYGTIVVTRQTPSGTKRLFGGGVTDRLLRDLPDLALWVLG
ncbi:MAG: putative Universal stress protein [Nitrospira sp.]|nr:putative Universal stress protein [Nitrospira sp.]